MLTACRIMQVYFGVKGGALTQTAVAKSDTYTAAEMCGIIANSSGYIYPGALPTWGTASGVSWRVAASKLCLYMCDGSQQSQAEHLTSCLYSQQADSHVCSVSSTAYPMVVRVWRSGLLALSFNLACAQGCSTRLT